VDADTEIDHFHYELNDAMRCMKGQLQAEWISVRTATRNSLDAKDFHLDV